MEKEMMTLTLENGTKEEVELLLSFKFNDNNKEYVIYTKNEKYFHVINILKITFINVIVRNTSKEILSKRRIL